MLEIEVTVDHLDPFMAIADTIIGEIDPSSIRDKVAPDFPIDRLEEYCKLTPSRVPGFREEACRTINGSGLDNSRLFVVVMALLSSRVAAPVLTGSLTLVTDMTAPQREALLASLRDSPIPVKRKLFKSFFSLSVTVYQLLAGDLHNKAIGYPGRELREMLFENQRIDPFTYHMIDRVKYDNTELHLPNIDALIIGSGAGAGVVAHTLQNEGYNCLVLEKGKYYSPKEYIFDDKQGLDNLYEGRGRLIATSGEIFVLAGATFGGGTTVNWSASLKTPFKVRKEWYDDYGVEFVADEGYDKCTDYVLNQMGANTDNINHSRSNRAILNSAKTLGYHAAEVNQNCPENHDCGFCYLGCKFGMKQGSQACWLRDAADKGCQFLDQVRVSEIIHSGGKAIGVRCVDKVTGFNFVIKGPKKIIVSGGSLNTPILLNNSNFKNKHIGKNLKLHPVLTMSGIYPQAINIDAFKHPIMTSVSNQAADLDGKAHGPRIETILHAPFVESTFIPWLGAEQFRKDLVNYNHTASMLIITRDKGSGAVRADPKRPDDVLVDYSIDKYDSEALLEGFLVAADMLYMDGAIELLHPQGWSPRFQTSKPKEERKITDADYVEWRNKVKKIGHSRYGPSYGSAHQMSTCRMSGKGPKYGAVDLKGRLFECKNVVVADASVLPTASGANPMITTMAIARHIALELAKDIAAQPKL